MPQRVIICYSDTHRYTSGTSENACETSEMQLGNTGNLTQKSQLYVPVKMPWQRQVADYAVF
jgi:hypothetical protein